MEGYMTAEEISAGLEEAGQMIGELDGKQARASEALESLKEALEALGKTIEEIEG